MNPDPAACAFERALSGLRERFVAGCGERLERMERLLGGLDKDPSDAGVLYDLMIQFHGFAGSGSTYGFPRVSVLGMEGERLCEALRKGNLPPRSGDRARLRELLESLREEVGRDAGSGGAAEVTTVPFDVLVVDPDPQSLGALERLASREGITVRGAASRAEALEEVARRRPDGVVVRTPLPDGTGYDLVETLRSLPSGEGLAILMSGKASAFANRVDAIHCGADGYFDRLQTDDLLRRLEHLLERCRTEAPRVLSVEDDADQAAFIRAVLESAGYVVRICQDPRDLGADLSTFHPDLVLLDIQLPGTDGFALARYIRQQEAYAALPVLFLTTRAHIESQIESLRAGGDDYLVKPVAPGLLLSAAAARIERARFLRSLLERDGLTRLLTHTAFLERARAMASKGSGTFARGTVMVLLDLDGFKSLNDRYGHPAGDTVLCSLAGLLRRRLRQSDLVGRLGGDEFAAIIEKIGERQALRLLERIREEFSAVEFGAGERGSFHATFSAGVAVLEPGMDADRWRERADAALYAAKSSGRNRVAIAV
jgi:diguanylate cyclase (GGDEF)-like protein